MTTTTIPTMQSVLDRTQRLLSEIQATLVYAGRRHDVGLSTAISKIRSAAVLAERVARDLREFVNAWPNMPGEQGTDDTPRYKHDCKYCTFLGHCDDADLYYCVEGNSGIPTLIARFSSDPAHYSSGAVFGEKGLDPYLSAAYIRAVRRGLKVRVDG